MPEWLSVPLLVDCILVGLFLEIIWLALGGMKRPQTGTRALMVFNGISGTFLLLAVKWTQDSLPTVYVVLALSGAGAFHIPCLWITFSNSGVLARRRAGAAKSQSRNTQTDNT